MKAINARKDLRNFVMVIFPHFDQTFGHISVIKAGMDQLGAKLEMAYFCKSRSKGKEFIKMV